MARKFKDLSEREILALAVSLEEEDGRVYSDFAEGLRETYPATAKLFDDMASRGVGAPGVIVRDLPVAVWRAYSADPA